MRGKRKDTPHLELCFLTSNEKEKRGGKKEGMLRPERKVLFLIRHYHSVAWKSWAEGCEDVGFRGQGVLTLSQQFPIHILTFLHKNELWTAYYFSV